MLATVISYSTDEELAIEFYSNLSRLIRDIPKHNVKIIGSDLNSQIGKSDCKGPHYLPTSLTNVT